MLQALIKQKIDRYFNTPPYQIEDLLTSVVFGSCAYVDMHKGLLPFLYRAKDAIGNASRRLTDLLGYVESVEYEFWPSWGSTSLQMSDGIHNADMVELVEGPCNAWSQV